jgi:hypothetical protein
MPVHRFATVCFAAAQPNATAASFGPELVCDRAAGQRRPRPRDKLSAPCSNHWSMPLGSEQFCDSGCSTPAGRHLTTIRYGGLSRSVASDRAVIPSG